MYKPAFQVRDPGRDGTAKMMCTVKKDEFACDRDDEDYLNNHIFGARVRVRVRVGLGWVLRVRVD